MIIDVQNTVNGAKNGSMARVSLSRSPKLGILAIVLVVSQCAAGEVFFSWRATDGSTTFSDRLPLRATDITVRKLSNPIFQIRESRMIEDMDSDETRAKIADNDPHRDLQLACEPWPSTKL